jgi:hypothetical protein
VVDCPTEHEPSPAAPRDGLERRVEQVEHELQQLRADFRRLPPMLMVRRVGEILPMLRRRGVRREGP